MVKSSPIWMQRRKKDQYYRLAKLKGYRSRAAFKLLYLIKRYRFIDRGYAVLDLGAAPGGWSQVLAEIVGDEGYVLGVDLSKIEPLESQGVEFMQLDINSESAINILKAKTRRFLDAVVSDASPNVTGAWDLDHSRQIQLASRSLEIARALLKRGGNFLVKVFQGSELEDFMKDVKRYFSIVKIVKPPATRPSSAELYILCLNYVGCPDSPPPPQAQD
ncbi:RlmE family RNA methyltransferase [Candidatus Bathyarchaeota archaeon]|nr:RlmE family RNA methyltransferase [Candidatus Bathyarchaeota archaeon]